MRDLISGLVCALLSLSIVAPLQAQEGATPWWQTTPDKTEDETVVDTSVTEAPPVEVARTKAHRSDALGFSMDLPENWSRKTAQVGSANVLVFSSAAITGGVHASLTAQRDRMANRKFDEYITALEGGFLKPTYKFKRSERTDVTLGGLSSVRLTGSGHLAAAGKTAEVHLIYYVVDLDDAVLVLGFIGSKAEAEELTGTARAAARTLKLFDPPYTISASGAYEFSQAGAAIQPIAGWRIQIETKAEGRDITFFTGPQGRGEKFAVGQIAVRKAKAALATYAAKMKGLLVRAEQGSTLVSESTFNYFVKDGPNRTVQKAYKIVWDAGSGDAAVRSVCTLIDGGEKTKVILVIRGLKKDFEAAATGDLLTKLTESIKPISG